MYFTGNQIFLVRPLIWCKDWWSNPEQLTLPKLGRFLLFLGKKIGTVTPTSHQSFRRRKRVKNKIKKLSSVLWMTACLVKARQKFMYFSAKRPFRTKKYGKAWLFKLCLLLKLPNHCCCYEVRVTCSAHIARCWDLIITPLYYWIHEQSGNNLRVCLWKCRQHIWCYCRIYISSYLLSTYPLFNDQQRAKFGLGKWVRE